MTKRPQPYVVEYGERPLNKHRYVSQVSATQAIMAQLDNLERSAAKFNKAEVEIIRQYKETIDKQSPLDPGEQRMWVFHVDSINYRLPVRLRREYR